MLFAYRCCCGRKGPVEILESHEIIDGHVCCAETCHTRMTARSDALTQKYLACVRDAMIEAALFVLESVETSVVDRVRAQLVERHECVQCRRLRRRLSNTVEMRDGTMLRFCCSGCQWTYFFNNPELWQRTGLPEAHHLSTREHV